MHTTQVETLTQAEIDEFEAALLDSEPPLHQQQPNEEKKKRKGDPETARQNRKKCKKQRKGNNKVEEKEEGPIQATTYERWCVDSLEVVKELVLKSETEAMLSKIKMNTGMTKRRVDYRSVDFAEGRVYGIGYQSTPCWIRRICAHKFYMDIDMRNAGPRFFIQILRKENLKVPGLLKKYANDRESFYPLVREFMPSATNVEIKQLLLAAFHCGGGHASTGQAPTVVDMLREQVKQIARTLSSLPAYAPLYEECVALKKDDNPLGSFISRCWQRIENKSAL